MCPGTKEEMGSNSRVDTAHFSYSKYEINSGFRRNVGQGGPMREGLFVRIANVDGEIARLEIAR